MNDEQFYDVAKHRPRKGQVMAKYTAVAEFIHGQAKQDVIRLLQMDKAVAAVNVMKKIHHVREPECFRVLREMAEDLLVMTPEEVEQKPYKMVIEYFYYTDRSNVPTDDPHWEMIPLLDYDPKTGKLTSKIII